MKKLTPGLALSAALLLVVVAVSSLTGAGAPVIATHAPANKVAAAGGTITAVPLATTAAAGSEDNNILTATLKTSSPTDLVLAVTLECSLITQVFVPGTTEQGASSTGSSEGQIRVWIVVDDTYIVPIQDGTGTVKGHAVGEDIDKVTFCNREHRLTVTDMEDPQDGVDQQEHYLRTKDANSFNWIALNLGSGIHTIEVRADFTAPTSSNSTGSSSSGFIGNRSLVVTPTKMANDATI